MPKTWQEVRGTAKASGLVEEASVAANREQLQGQILAYRLGEIRKAHGISQEQLATAMGITQSRVSRIENGDVSRAELSTLASYIIALGGDIHVVAEFDGQQVVVL